MLTAKKVLLAGMLELSAAYKLSPMNSLHRLFHQLPLGFGHNNVDVSRFRCDLGKPLDPSNDGLYSSYELFAPKEAVETLIQRHQPLVRIDSVCYDDLGDFDKDERWRPFDDIPKVLEDKYPLMQVSHNPIFVEYVC